MVLLMDIQEAIFKRRTIHLFDKKKVSEKLIENAIEAANQAPCHKLTFPWRFYSVSSKKRIQILDLALDIKFLNKNIDNKSKNLFSKKYLDPSHLLIASQVLSEDPLIKKEDYAACSCTIQNLSLSLTSAGVFTKWSTGAITRNPDIYNIAGIDPSKEELIGFIWIGYGKELPEISRPLISNIYKKI